MALKALRFIAVLLGLSLMLGELWRSWGTGRPIVFILDDQIMGALLIISAIAVRRETQRTRAAYSAAWGFACGMLYLSFFEKLFEPENTQAGNWSLNILTALVGVAFTVSICGLLLSIALQKSRAERTDRLYGATPR